MAQHFQGISPKRIALVAPPANRHLAEQFGPSCSHLAGLRASFLGEISRSFVGQNLGLHQVATGLRRRAFAGEVIDAWLQELPTEELIQILTQGDFDIVGFHCLENTLQEIQDIAFSVKSVCNNVLLVGGGPACIIAPDFVAEKCPSLDLVFTGDGSGFAEYMDRHFVNGQSGSGMSVDLLGISADAYTALRKGFALGISSSRGCSYGRCKFCTLPSLGQRLGYQWEPRPPKEVLEEFSFLQGEFHPQWITFTDEDFLGGNTTLAEVRRRELAEGLSRRNRQSIKLMFDCRVDQVNHDTFSLLKDAGLSRVFLGIEHNADKALKHIGKGTKRKQIDKALNILETLQIDIVPGYIQFLPWDTPIESLEAFEFYASFEKYDLWKPMSALRVYHGTCLQREWPIEATSPWYNDAYQVLARFSNFLLPKYLLWTQGNRLVPSEWIRKFAVVHHGFVRNLLGLYAQCQTPHRPDPESVDRIFHDWTSRFIGLASQYENHLRLIQ